VTKYKGASTDVPFLFVIAQLIGPDGLTFTPVSCHNTGLRAAAG
jgi:hypothetical protein